MPSKIVPYALTAVMALSVAAARQTASAETLEPVSVTVRTSDIDLSTSDGAHRMLQRIRRAAKQACWSQDSDVVTQSTRYLPCVDETTGLAVARLNAPMVTALLQGRRPTPTRWQATEG